MNKWFEQFKRLPKNVRKCFHILADGFQIKKIEMQLFPLIEDFNQTGIKWTNHQIGWKGFDQDMTTYFDEVALGEEVRILLTV